MSEIVLVGINAHTGSAPVTLRFATQGYVTPAPRTNLLLYSEAFNNAAWIKVGGTTASSASTVNTPNFNEAIYEVVTTAAPVGQAATFSVTLSGSGTTYIGVARSGYSTYEETKTKITLTSTPTRYSATHTIVNSGQTGFLAFISRGPDGTATTLEATQAQLEKNPAATTYIATTSAAVTVPTAGQENLYYEGRVSQPGNTQRTVFDKGTTFGASKTGFGEVVLVNNDGALDYLLPYGFAGFSITITRGYMTPNLSAPVWTTVLVGTMDSVDFSWSEVSIKVRDRQQELAKPLQSVLYGGTNSLPNGLDGVSTDIKGNGKPILFGKVYNIAPPRVNTTRIIYQLSDGLIQAVNAVYDRGVVLTAGAAYSSQADMETNAPTAGQYRAWLNAAGSYIRLGSEPAGTVTVDATQGATAADRTSAQLMKAVLLKGGIVTGDINAADVTALDTAANYECGYWHSGNPNSGGSVVMDALSNSAGAWWGVDRLGKFRMRQIVSPLIGDSIGTITAVEIVKIDRVRSSDEGRGVPAWQISLNYARMFYVQQDLAAAVGVVLKTDRAEEWRTVVSNDASVKTQWPKAVEITFDTHLISAADAATEAARRLALYKVRRDTLQARVKLPDALASAIDLGVTITLQVPRFGLSSGKAYLVTGIRTDLRNNTFDLTLWG